MCEDKCQQLRAFRHLTCCLDQTSKVPFLLITTNQCSAYIMTWHASSGPQQQAQPIADLVVAVIHDNLRVEKVETLCGRSSKHALMGDECVQMERERRREVLSASWEVCSQS